MFLGGGAVALGGGGGGVGALRWYGPVGGGDARLGWFGNGELMGATLGVDFRVGGFATMGTSFQSPVSLALGGGGAAVGWVVLGGAP